MLSMFARLVFVLASPLHVIALSSTYYTLRHLYEVTDGANWKNNENWLDGEPCQNDWMSSSHYDCFSGKLMSEQQPICCQASANSLASVVKLDLYDNRLSGTIPKQLTNLDSLRLLVLDSNSLHGTIPPEIGDMYYLKVLWLQNNALSGSIPTELMKYLGAFEKDLGYNFEPGGIILRPNNFNCSIIDAEGMDWANTSLKELFRDEIAPSEYNEQEQDKGCIEGDVVAANMSNLGMLVNQEETMSLAEEAKKEPLAVVLAVFSAAVAAVLMLELLRRMVRRRARSHGKQSAEEKEGDRAAQQRLRMGRRRQVEMMDLEQDRMLGEEAATRARANRASCRASGTSRLSSVEGKRGNMSSDSRRSTAGGKARRPSIVGFMGKSHRPSIFVAGASEQPAAAADKPARKGRRGSLFGAGPKACATDTLPRASAGAPSVTESIANGGKLPAGSSVDSTLGGSSSRRSGVSSGHASTNRSSAIDSAITEERFLP